MEIESNFMGILLVLDFGLWSLAFGMIYLDQKPKTKDPETSALLLTAHSALNNALHFQRVWHSKNGGWT